MTDKRLSLEENIFMSKLRYKTFEFKGESDTWSPEHIEQRLSIPVIKDALALYAGLEGEEVIKCVLLEAYGIPYESYTGTTGIDFDSPMLNKISSSGKYIRQHHSKDNYTRRCVKFNSHDPNDYCEAASILSDPKNIDLVMRHQWEDSIVHVVNLLATCAYSLYRTQTRKVMDTLEHFVGTPDYDKVAEALYEAAEYKTRSNHNYLDLDTLCDRMSEDVEVISQLFIKMGKIAKQEFYKKVSVDDAKKLVSAYNMLLSIKNEESKVRSTLTSRLAGLSFEEQITAIHSLEGFAKRLKEQPEFCDFYYHTKHKAFAESAPEKLIAIISGAYLTAKVTNNDKKFTERLDLVLADCDSQEEMESAARQYSKNITRHKSPLFLKIYFDINDRDFADNLSTDTASTLMQAYDQIRTYGNSDEKTRIGALFTDSLNSKLELGHTLQEKESIATQWSHNLAELLQNNAEDLFDYLRLEVSR